jgi:hypothetical protein
VIEIAGKQRWITKFLSEFHAVDELDVVSLIARVALRIETACTDGKVELTGSPEKRVIAFPAVERAIEELLTSAFDHGVQGPIRRRSRVRR